MGCSWLTGYFWPFDLLFSPLFLEGIIYYYPIVRRSIRVKLVFITQVGQRAYGVF